MIQVSPMKRLLPPIIKPARTSTPDTQFLREFRDQRDFSEPSSSTLKFPRALKLTHLNHDEYFQIQQQQQ